MPKGQMKCKICNGKGTLTENVMEYEFITRDPITSKCLICNGKGWVACRSKLPDGTPARAVRLNVSRKASILPEVPDTGVGYKPDEASSNTEKSRGGRRKAEGKEPYESPMFFEVDKAATRVNKVLASGKQFLIVTQTEPYYLDVFRMIRAQERAQNTWSPEDEENYIQALEQTIQTYKEASNG